MDKPYNYSSVVAQSACTLASCDVAAVPLATAVSSSSLHWTPEVVKDLIIFIPGLMFRCKGCAHARE